MALQTHAGFPTRSPCSFPFECTSWTPCNLVRGGSTGFPKTSPHQKFGPKGDVQIIPRTNICDVVLLVWFLATIEGVPSKDRPTVKPWLKSLFIGLHVGASNHSRETERWREKNISQASTVWGSLHYLLPCRASRFQQVDAGMSGMGGQCLLRTYHG